MSKRFYACVYGGASEKIDPVIKQQVEKLGRILVENGYALVYGAGATGCMGAVARGVQNQDGYVMGISPHFISEFEPIFDCDNTVMVDTMSERKTLMEKHADIFLIVPGGVGTMDEFFQVLTLKYLRRINTPIVILNLNGFYDSLLVLMDELVKQGALSQEARLLFDVVNTVDEEQLISVLQEIKKN